MLKLLMVIILRVVCYVVAIMSAIPFVWCTGISLAYLAGLNVGVNISIALLVGFISCIVFIVAVIAECNVGERIEV